MLGEKLFEIEQQLAKIEKILENPISSVEYYDIQHLLKTNVKQMIHYVKSHSVHNTLGTIPKPVLDNFVERWNKLTNRINNYEGIVITKDYVNSSGQVSCGTNYTDLNVWN